MGPPHSVLILMGALMLIGLVAHEAGQRTALPRVSLLILGGVLVGPSGFDLLPAGSHDHWFPMVANVALAIVGFQLGESLKLEKLRKLGGRVLAISLAVIGVTALAVGWGLVALGVPWVAALLLGGVATATDPAATLDVVGESRAEGPFTDTLLAIVAVDDAWGVMLFSILLAAADAFTGSSPGSGMDALTRGGWEIGGALLVGLVLGIPTALLSGRLEPGEPTVAETLGAVLLCGGVALWLEVSFLLASIVLGATVANLARHHARPFHSIDGVREPFLILFFVLSGASLEIGELAALGAAGGGYVVLRAGSRVAGAWLGARLTNAPPSHRRSMGLALMPQAGVALGMALLGAQRFPDVRDTLLPIAIGSTVLFELVGPVATRAALRRVGESH